MSNDMGIMFYVTDLKESAEFFQNALGFSFKGYWDDATQSVVESWDDAEEPSYAVVIWGDAEVGLHPAEEVAATETTVKAYFHTDDVDAVWEQATSEGVDATEPQDFPWGARMFTVTTPDGHEIDFLEEI